VVAVMLGGGDAPIVPGSRVPAFSFPEQAAGVLGRSYSYARWLTVEASIEHDPVRAVDPAAAASLIDEALDDDGSAVLDVQRTRRLLWSYGIEMALARSATPDTAEAIADEIGYPVAVKALHRRPGRSARAGVALDLADGRDVVEAIATMTESLGDDAEQLVVQKMVAPGVDVRVRCDRDDRLGAIVTIGLGGEQAEVIGDRSSRLAPLSPAIARSMLRETRAGVALGESGFDESPLVDLVVSAAQLIADHRAVTSIDLNPVMVSTVGAFVTDATVVIGRPTTVEPPLRSL
jgi:acyl-CoA synthetase (NDP forming)